MALTLTITIVLLLFLISGKLVTICARLKLIDTGAKLPVSAANQIALYDGDDAIYLIGGYNGSYQDTVVKYTLESGHVSASGIFLPIAWGVALMATSEDILYLGGHTDQAGNGRSSTIYRYSTVSGAFTNVSHFPLPFVSMALAWDEANQAAYVFGGYTDEIPQEMNQVYRYNVTTNEDPFEIATLSTARYAASGAWDSAHGVGYVFGGRTGSMYDILQVDPVAETIYNLRTKLPTEVAYGCAVYADRSQSIYVMGGNADDNFNLIRFDPGRDYDYAELVDVEGWSQALSDPACVYVSSLNRIYVIGGGERGAGGGSYRDQIMYLSLNDADDEDELVSMQPSPWYSLLLVVPLLLIGLGYGGAWLRRRKAQRREKAAQVAEVDSENVFTPAEIQEFEEGAPHPEYQFIAQPYVCRENINYQSYDRAFELSPDAIDIDLLHVLGSGEFGIVVKGVEVATGKPVGVKTVKPHVRKKAHLQALLGELKIRIYLGPHPHVVNLVGACTTGLSRGLMYLFVEFCPLGDLENYLRRRKEAVGECEDCGFAPPTCNYPIRPPCSSGSRYLTVDDLDLDFNSVCDLVRWSVQVASAMEYLASKKVIHGDLAARNVLLACKSCAKVTDFGLARKLYSYTSYAKTYDTPLPWRSLAVESLVEGAFSTQSDVWSFGVTLWEIFSLGGIPYSTGTNFSMEFVTQLQDGVKLQAPAYCPPEVYEEVMLKCWNLNPADRPSFADLHNQLKLIEQNCRADRQLNTYL